jgi:hypothetical protein
MLGMIYIDILVYRELFFSSTLPGAHTPTSYRTVAPTVT